MLIPVFLASPLLAMTMQAPAELPKKTTGAAAARGVKIDQILPYDLKSRTNTSSSNQIDADRLKSNDATKVSQLPGDIEVVDDGEAGPEKAITRNEESPEARLYSQVAEVWQLIRQRGQQPTPELIAREIGPDALTSFLDQNPGSESIFGRDSDQLPVPQPGQIDLPDGAGTIFLPPTGG